MAKTTKKTETEKADVTQKKIIVIRNPTGRYNLANQIGDDITKYISRELAEDMIKNGYAEER